MPSRHRAQPGVVLLLALLLMAAITASTIGISTVITSTLHQTQNSDNFIVASLASDTGLERGLAIVKAGRQSQAIDTTSTEANISNQALSNQALFSLNSLTQTAAYSGLRLLPDQSVSIDLLNYDTSGSIQQPTDKFLKVIGTDLPKSIAGDPGSPYPGRGILDLSWVVLDNGGNPVYTGRHLIGPGELDGHNYGAINLLDKLCDTTNNCNIHPNISLIGGIRVTIRAVNSTDVTFASPNSQDTQNNIDLETVSNISITPQDVNGDATDLPSTFSLNSTGKYNGSQSLKNASVLWQLPSSRVFNFVLFSEGNITPQ